MRIAAPASLKGKLDFYVDVHRQLSPVLAPAGWRCATNLGADGTNQTAVYPPGSPDTLNSTGPAHGNVQTVIAYNAPVCGGCAALLACSVFTNAFINSALTTCPLNSPKLESVSYLDGSPSAKIGTAQIYDPPNVYGSLPQSGGLNPATGTISFSSAQITSGGVLSCVLPASEANLCDAIVHQYERPLGT
jgi:hypothetical protein